MPDPKVLKAHGISSGDYKKIFTMPEKPGRVQKLIDLITNRVKDGFNRNLSEWQTYAAVDIAYDAPFNQTTATFVRHLLAKKYEKAEEMLADVAKWGLKESDLFLDVNLKDGKQAKVLNVPVFFNVLIPIVKSYCDARIATLFNERNTTPLLPYKPLKKTAKNRVISEVITDLVSKISTDYGYAAYLDQAIKQTVKYGLALSFPLEEWDCEEQMEVDEDSTKENPKFKKVTVKEGLRYIFPHPTRMGYDLYHPLTSLNSDSGCEFAYFWDVVPYSKLLDNRNFWNRSRITYGTNWFNHELAGNYFNEFYPCRLKFPTVGLDGEMKREDKAALYSSSERDKAVFFTQFFMKLRPRDWDLGKYETVTDATGKKVNKLVKTYDHYVWHRFYVANDSTIIWAEPCAYVPSWFMGYNYDSKSGRQSGLGLETIPWQDHLGNIVSQMMLTAKQNLSNVIYYDTNMVDKDDIDELKNLGEGRYRSLNFIPYNSMKTSRSGNNPKDAFVSVQLNYRSIQDMVQMMGTILDLMERVLQFTAQEVGSTAKHYQSAEEIKTVNQSSDQKTNYTGSAIDAGRDAWKKQIYEAARSYMDAGFESEVSDDIPGVEGIIDELGFTITGRSKGKIHVKGHKSKLRLDQFARTGGDHEQDTDQQTAQAMFNVIGIIASHEEIFQPIGAKRVISLLEQAAKLAGADKDFKLNADAPKTVTPGAPVHPETGEPITSQPQAKPGQPAPGAAPAQPAPAGQPAPQPDIQSQLAHLVPQLEQAVMTMVQEKFAKPVADEIVKQEQQIQQLGALVQQIEALLKRTASPVPAPAPEPVSPA